MRLTFLLPNEISVAMTTLARGVRAVLWNNRLITVCVGSIGIGLFLSYWPDEQSLLVFIEVKRAQQFCEARPAGFSS